MDSTVQKRARLPFEGAARTINQQAELYLSEGQQRGLAAGMLAGVVLLAAGIAWSIGRAFRRNQR